MTPAALKELIAKTQRRFEAIDKADYDTTTHRYRTSETARWQKATKEVAPAEWVEFVRVLAQGQSYYDGRY